MADLSRLSEYERDALLSLEDARAADCCRMCVASCFRPFDADQFCTECGGWLAALNATPQSRLPRWLQTVILVQRLKRTATVLAKAAQRRAPPPGGEAV